MYKIVFFLVFGFLLQEPHLVFYLLVAQVPLPLSSHGIFLPFPTNGLTAHEENYPLLAPLLLLRYEHLRKNVLL